VKQFLIGAGTGVLIIAVAAMVYLRLTAKNLPISDDSPRPAISASGRDWLENVVGTSEEVMTKMLVATTVSGKITDINQEKGKFPISGSYYTGEPGFYAYAGQLKLVSENGPAERFYLSPRRMELIKVFNPAGGEIEFDDLKAGDAVEMEETVDLVIPNQDDANVLSLIIRIK
jgi:hypothetical protein